MTFSDPEIYFHVGLGKAASTYLQKRVFPAFTDIHYIHRNLYARAPSVIDQGRHPRYLVSREFGRNFESKVARFAGRYPRSRPIIVLRRHDSWIASQYRRYVKNGGSLPLTGFIDIEDDAGVWRRSELDFYARLKILERCLKRPPRVFFYEDLQRDPMEFIRRFARCVGARVPGDGVSLLPKHRSYDESPLILLRTFNRELGRSLVADDLSPRVRWWRHRLTMFASYAILHPARLLPARFIPRESLIDDAALERIRVYGEADWQRCIDYARTSAAATQSRQAT